MPKPGPHSVGHRYSSCLNTVERLFVNRKLRKLSFYLLILFLAILTAVDVVKLVRCYLNENTDTDMSVEFKENMTMPNLTFCISKEHAWSHFKLTNLTAADVDRAVEEGLRNMSDKTAFMNQRWDYRMIIDAYPVIQSLNSMERETSSLGALNSILTFANAPRLAMLRNSTKKWLDAIEKRNISFEEFQQKVGNETLLRSLQRFQRLSKNEQGRQIRNSYKITWLSQQQLCFQPLFDMDNFKPIEDQDQFFTVTLAHNTENVEWVDCMTLDMRGRPSDEARYLEGKGRAKDGFFDELCIGDMHEIEVEIRSIYTSLPDSEEAETKCLVYKEDGAKSEFECRSRCRLELIRKACSCTPLTLSYLVTDPGELQHFPRCNYEECKIDPHSFNFSNWDNICGEQCYPDCTQTRYHIEHHKRTSPRKELLQVTLFWGSFEYLRLYQKEKWSFPKFFSNIGGSLGVWLGLSVLSLIQFITFLLIRAQKKVANKKVSSVSTDGRNHSKQHSTSSNPLGGGLSMNPFGTKKKQKQ